jgi:glucose/mannose-6-phosphate isomerase
MMDTLIERFPAQLKEALEIGISATINAHTETINNVYVAGLGGSGIGGNFTQGFIRKECKVPFTVGKGYDIPAWIDKNTLTIISSYSGNTEETLSAFKQIQKTGSKIVCVASGGKLIEIAEEKGYDHIKLPDDWPSPRACLGFSMTQQLFVLNKLNLISNKTIDQVRKSIDLISFNQDEIMAEAKKIADFLVNKMPIIYTTDRMSAVALRLRQQINENAKMLCWHHIIPEMNHNEVLGWGAKDDNFAVLYFRNDDDFKRNAIRIDINKKIIANYTPNIMEVFSKGNSLVERSIYFINLGDWVSWYLSQLRGVDAVEIDVINYLKGELSKV